MSPTCWLRSWRSNWLIHIASTHNRWTLCASRKSLRAWNKFSVIWTVCPLTEIFFWEFGSPQTYERAVHWSMISSLQSARLVWSRWQWMSDDGSNEGSRRSRRIESLLRSGSYWKSAILLSFTVARRTVYEVAIMSILMKLGKEKKVWRGWALQYQVTWQNVPCLPTLCRGRYEVSEPK